jgi:Arrestin (or S-antigen), C-terminal domain
MAGEIQDAASRRSSLFNAIVTRQVPPPPPPPLPTHTDAASLKIELENAPKRYYPGQSVRGHLTIKVQESIGVQYIRIAAVGGLKLRSTSKRESNDYQFTHDLIILNSGVRVTRQAGVKRDRIPGRTKRDRWHMVYDRTTLPSRSGRYDNTDGEDDDEEDGMETSSRSSRHDSKYASMSSYSSSVESFFTLDSQSHDIAFSIPIPRSNVIPPSYTTDQFNIQYSVIATLHYETMESTSIHVVNCYQPLQLSSLTPIYTPLYNTPLVAVSRRAPVTHPNSKYKSLLSSTGWIEASAFVPRRAFLPGDSIPLGIRIINCSDFRPGRATVDVTLTRNIVISAGRESKKKINGLVGVFEGISGQDRELQLDMDSLLSVPAESISTIFADMTQNLLEVVYKVHIKVSLIGTIKTSKPMLCFNSRKQSEHCEHIGVIEFPIVIGTLPKCASQEMKVNLKDTGM